MTNLYYILLKKLTQESKKLDYSAYFLSYHLSWTERISRSLLVVKVFLLDLYH